jgi:hypothetical protein
MAGSTIGIKTNNCRHFGAVGVSSLNLETIQSRHSNPQSQSQKMNMNNQKSQMKRKKTKNKKSEDRSLKGRKEDQKYSEI